MTANGATIPFPNPDGGSLARTLTDGDTNTLEWGANDSVIDLTHSAGSDDEITEFLTDATGMVMIRNVSATNIIINTGNNILCLGGSLRLTEGDAVVFVYQERIDAWCQYGAIIPGAANTVSALTDNSGGTASGSNEIEAIGGTYSQSEVANNFATISSAISRLQKAVGIQE